MCESDYIQKCGYHTHTNCLVIIGNASSVVLQFHAILEITPVYLVTFLGVCGLLLIIVLFGNFSLGGGGKALSVLSF